jgi:hypothetical protein
MTEILEFDTAHGPVLVEADETTPGYADIAREGGLTARAAATLDGALSVIRPVTTTVIEQFQRVARPPSEVRVEFGLKLTMAAGAVIAASTTEGHLTVSCTWHHPEVGQRAGGAG